MNCRSNSTCDEQRWVVQIRQSLDEELEDEDEVPVCIFNVPKSLMSSDPDSYTPQQVAIGPYHYWRPELHEMERYKLAAAKRARKNLQNLKFQDLVDQLTHLEPRIRGSYHKYLDFNGETLAWMMAIDASFLLELLQMYGMRQGKVVRRDSSRILRDIVMLENQIPLFVLRKVLELQSSSSDDLLLPMLLGLCQELSPFKMVENLPQIQVSDLAHLLDFLYQTVMPLNLQDTYDQDKEEVDPDQDQEQEQSSRILRLMKVKKQQSLDLFKRVLTSKPVKLMLRLPWTVISNLPVFAILKQPVESLILTQDHDRDQEQSNPPLVEEITIPSVSELSSSGVSFVPTNGNISSISFNTDTTTLYLPVTTFDVNTEVVLRNLVAYEASNASGPLVFTRYTELMNGIIDTEEDVKVLRERGIVLNRMKSDGEVADMWNGMSKSVRLTKVEFLDKVIGDVNKYYDRRWKIRIAKFMKLHVFRSWQSLTLAAAILLLFLVSLQTFCALYRYNRALHMNT